MPNIRRRGWRICGGTDDDGWDIHLAFVLATVLTISTVAGLIVVAVRTSGPARFGAIFGAVVFGLLVVWTAAVLRFLYTLVRKLRSRPPAEGVR